MQSSRRRSIRGRAFALAVTLAAAAAAVPLTNSSATAAPTELFFSEYIEGSSNNKALEIYNGTGGTVDLAAENYNVQMFFNGSATAGLTISLTGPTVAVADGDVYVLAQSAASPSILAVADQTNGSGWFNGDDAVVLRKGTIIIDVIGQVGIDPGTEWGTGVTSTADNTLRRKPSIQAGDPNHSDAFDPAVEWDGFATDTFDGLGAHVIDDDGDNAPTVTATSPASGAVNVAPSSDVSITFSEPVDVTDPWFSLSCASTGSHTAAVTGGPITFTLDPDTDFGPNETCTATVFASQVTDQDADDPPDNMAGDAVSSFTTADPLVCGAPATLIHAIQGDGATAAQTGVRTVEGVVVGDYQGAGQFSGYFLQEEDGDTDANPLTSEGIFVFNTSTPVSVGDRVRVRATAGEFGGMTQLSNVTATEICGTGFSVTPSSVTLPVAAVSDLERFEGMKVTVSQELTVTEVFTLARFGEAALSVGGRLETPTNAVAPGAPALALQNLNDRSRILLDDGNNQQNIDPTLHPQGGLSATNTLRVGDSLPSLTGVLEFRFSRYRVQPVGGIAFTHSNPRPLAPEPVGGNLRVAAFNVLNYFNGNGSGLDGAAGGFPTARGASNLFEFNRQRDKIIDAISALDAHVVGLMELENDVTAGGEFGAIEDLVAGLNDFAGSARYDFIDTGVVGTDAIRVGIIYQPGSVTPVGSHAIMDSTVDPDFIDTLNRPSIAQTFELNATGARFTAVVNHLKSKGSDCNHVGDPDTGDGQGNCNGTRTLAAGALVDWLATDPTGSGDPDVVVLGDLNAYAMEDPITVFKDAGYVDTIDAFAGSDSYSFVFQGQSGYLDHALASESLAAQVSGATEWHINADEPIALDYNVEFKSAGQVTTFYDPGPYRSSDHDPALVGFNLGAAPTVDAGGPYSVVEGSTVTVTATGSDPDNGTLTYAWDLDNNGSFETAGQSATFSAAGIEAPASRTIAVRVTDDEGFTATDTAMVEVVWDFSGFFPPVLNLPDVNSVKSGSSVAVKFSLGGNQGLSIFAAGSPASMPIDCTTGAPLGSAQPIALAGNSGLVYSASTDTYMLSWKTAKNWTGCRRLSVTLADGTVHQADFRFTR
ncbi:ExeM/NucH family extracellular endonuclease [Nocardioides speluncae]|uniref:ExeM/NucH family extracellular endonuclease n=1 Tax=Nocardioides speluncae TaxID=2670337 RepID=UPI000D687E9A|nr:ExeM/NucH family extracellular endonuclease [Nocardioides speluncae]